MRSLLTIPVALALAACGAAPPVPGAPIESAPAPIDDPAPTGPIASFVPPGTVVIARFDLAAMRASPNGGGWADLLSVQSAYRTVLAESGIDPIDHLDRALVLAPALYTNDTTFVLRHRETAAAIRERAVRTGDALRASVAWREVQGFTVGEWPCSSRTAHEVAITSEREVVIAPVGTTPRAIEVARDHRARGGALDPAFESEPGEIVRFWVGEVPPSLTLASHRVRTADLVVRLLDARTTDVALAFTLPSDAAALEAGAELERIAASAQREPMLAGLARILVRVRVSVEGDRATARATLDEDDVRTGLEAIRIAAPLLGM